jgi:hypothetical protein
MKINEIFGFGRKPSIGGFDWDTIKTDIAMRIEQWNKHMSKMGANLNDPAAYHSAIREWAQSMFSKADPAVLDAVQEIHPQKPQTAANYIRDVYISNLKAESAPDVLRKTTRSAPTDPAPAATPSGPRLHPDVKVIATTPNIVLRYGKQDFALNNADQWVRFGTTKPATTEMAAFLTKQLQAL